MKRYPEELLHKQRKLIYVFGDKVRHLYKTGHLRFMYAPDGAQEKEEVLEVLKLLDYMEARTKPDKKEKKKTVSAKSIPASQILIYRAEKAGDVKVAGSFNNWQPQKMDKGDKGVWSFPLNLPAGRYLYKLVVDGKWQKDAKNPKSVPDGLSGENSVLEVS